MVMWVVHSKLPLKSLLLPELIFVNFSLVGWGGGGGWVIERRVNNRENTVLM